MCWLEGSREADKITFKQGRECVFLDQLLEEFVLYTNIHSYAMFEAFLQMFCVFFPLLIQDTCCENIFLFTTARNVGKEYTSALLSGGRVIEFAREIACHVGN